MPAFEQEEAPKHPALRAKLSPKAYFSQILNPNVYQQRYYEYLLSDKEQALDFEMEQAAGRDDN